MLHTTIARAHPGDVPQLKAIEIECGLSPWSAAAYEAELARPDSIVLTATAADRIVGFIAGRRPLILDADAEINNIGVIRDFRGNGIASSLLKEFRRICVVRRARLIWLEVRQSKVAAIALYLSHGFVKRGVRRNFYHDPVEDAQLMSLTLAAEQ